MDPAVVELMASILTRHSLRLDSYRHYGFLPDGSMVWDDDKSPATLEDMRVMSEAMSAEIAERRDTAAQVCGVLYTPEWDRDRCAAVFGKAEAQVKVELPGVESHEFDYWALMLPTYEALATLAA